MVELTGILGKMYSEVKGRAESLLKAHQITPAEFKSLNAEYTSILEEARQTDTRLYEQFRADSIEIITRLRVKARAAAVEGAYELTALLSSLNSHFTVQPFQSNGTLPSHQTHGLLQEPSVEAKVVDVGYIGSNYGIDRPIAEKVAPLIGSYVSSEQVTDIAGYAKPTLYRRIKGVELKTQGRGKYLLDETAIRAFFGGLDISGKVGASNPEQKSRWMTADKITEEFGYASPAPFYARVREHPDAFQRNDSKRPVLYLITPENSAFLKRKRSPRNPLLVPTPASDRTTLQIPELPSLTGKILTYAQMSDAARPFFGERTDVELKGIVHSYYDRIRVGDGNFSGTVLEQILDHRRREMTATADKNPPLVRGQNGTITYDQLIERVGQVFPTNTEVHAADILENNRNISLGLGRYSSQKLEEILATVNP